MSITNKALENLQKFLDSPEGQKSLDDFVNKINNEDITKNSQINRFWDKYGDKLDYIIPIVIEKYSSGQYKERWYNRNIEPPETLYYFLYDVANVHGREFTDDEYQAKENMMFTANVYVLGNWTLELIIGQGSAILIDKIK